MRCTRCDGLAVPQAVGIDPQGKVVFGWCLECLADRKCALVETSPLGPWAFSPPAPPRGEVDRARERSPGPGAGGIEVDQTRWIVGIVAFLMMSWGLIVLTAGLCSTPRPDSEASPLGNGTPALLIAGGAATAVLGVGLLVLASRRNWYPGTFLLALLSWLSFLLGLGILVHGILLPHPRRYVGLVLGAGLCVGISALARVVHRHQIRKSPPSGPIAALMRGTSDGKSRATDRRTLL